MSSPYVLQALHDGADLGLCAYDGQNKLKQTLQQNRITQGIPIESIQPDGKIHTFIGIREASRMSELLFGKHLSRYFIKKYCATGEMWNGIMFKYVKK